MWRFGRRRRVRRERDGLSRETAAISAHVHALIVELDAAIREAYEATDDLRAAPDTRWRRPGGASS